MKQKIVLGLSAIISISFLLFAFVQKTHTEQVIKQLEICEKRANENMLEAEKQRERAEEQRMVAEMEAIRASELNIRLQNELENSK